MSYVIGDLEIDEARFELLRAGQSVPIEPRALQLLVYLIRCGGRVVPRRELLDALWKDTSVVDTVVSRCICLARQALGERSLIRTVYGRGYCWTGTAPSFEPCTQDSTPEASARSGVAVRADEPFRPALGAQPSVVVRSNLTIQSRNDSNYRRSARTKLTES